MSAAAGSAPIESTSGELPPGGSPTGESPREVVPEAGESAAGEATAHESAATEPAATGPAATGPAATGPAATEPAATGPAATEPVGELLDWVLVVAISIVTGWAAVIGLAYLPWYVGPLPLPVSALVGVAAMILAPRTCYRLTASMLGALLPVLSWFGVSVWVVLSYNRLLPTVPLTVIGGQWRVMLLLGFGALAAAATVGLIWGDRLRDKIARQQSTG